MTNKNYTMLTVIIFTPLASQYNDTGQDLEDKCVWWHSTSPHFPNPLKTNLYSNLVATLHTDSSFQLDQVTTTLSSSSLSGRQDTYKVEQLAVPNCYLLHHILKTSTAVTSCYSLA
jgi:hypothetical protein